MDAGCLHLFLELNPADAWKPRIEQETARTAIAPALAKRFGGCISLCVDSDRIKQIAQPVADGCVVIHNEYSLTNLRIQNLTHD
jgi:hypothetical protein